MEFTLSRIPHYMAEMTWEQLSNPDGSFNKECVPFEEYRTKWLNGSIYEDEYEWAQRRLYVNTLKRLHTIYRAMKEERSH